MWKSSVRTSLVDCLKSGASSTVANYIRDVSFMNFLKKDDMSDRLFVVFCW